MGKMKLGTKIIAGFIGVSIITLVLGIIGYYGAVKSEGSIDELGAVRLPSVESLLIISEAQTAVDSGENALLSTHLDAEARAAQHQRFSEAKKRADEAWAIYEPLPQTAEEAATWKEFVPAWEKWWQDHEDYVKLVREYEGTISGQEEAENLYAQMTEQALVKNSESFNKAEALLNAIVTIYENRAKNASFDDQTAFNRVAYFTIQSLLTISEAQTAIDSSENALLNRSISMKSRQGQYDRIAAAWKRAEDAWKVYEPLEQTAEEKKLWGQFVPAWNAWKADHGKYVALCHDYDKTMDAQNKAKGIYEKMNQQSLVTIGKSFTAAETLLNKLVEINIQVAEKTSHSSISQAAFLKIFSLIAMIIGVILALVLGVLITRSITKPINRIIEALGSGADQVSSASGQVSSASQSLAEGASEQAAAIEETSSSLEEMSSMTKQNADNAAQADSLMSEAKVVVDKAGVSMKEMNKSMGEISSAGQEIGKIIKTIDEIAFQTNLLALNAAVEAARAGEAGAGFAVVADEVRNLAQRAADAAKNTADLIEGTITRINQGTELVKTTDEAFTEVAASSTKVAELIGEIAAASSEQAQGIDQVNQAVSQMDQVTQTNAANAEESASASEELNAQAESMLEVVSELMTLVGGEAAASKMQADHQARQRSKAKRQALPVPIERRQPERNMGTKVVKGDDVIPMDDDFNDF